MRVKDEEINKAQGHWLLAKMGKRVLRPGGKELTEDLIQGLHIDKNDDVLEIAPGLGFTAMMTLNHQPKSYTGVDEDPEVIENLQQVFQGNDTLHFLKGNADKIDLPDDSITKLYGEAILTMNADQRKKRIIKEAARVVKKGGLYAIHEIGLTPDSISEDRKAEIQKELAMAIRVNARPLTIQEWKNLLENEGFEIVEQKTNGMFLLESKRIIQDEGLWRALKITWNIYTNKAAKKRINEMKSVFRKYQKDMNSVMLVARKK